jgi:hypothetical protein
MLYSLIWEYTRNLSEPWARDWVKVIVPSGFAVVNASYLGHYAFWWEIQRRNLLQKLCLKAIKRAEPYLKRLPAGCSIYSPYCGLIARRTSETPG